MAVAAGARRAHAQLERLDAEGKLDEGLRYEILHGDLVIQGSPRSRHGEVVALVTHHLSSWVGEHGGRVLVGVGVEIGAHRPIPDVVFFTPARAGEVSADGIYVPPDVIVEVTSPGTRSLDLQEKREVYAETGVPEYWVVDLTGDRVVVHRRGDAGLDEVGERTAGALTTDRAPGLEVPVAELLATGR